METALFVGIGLLVAIVFFVYLCHAVTSLGRWVCEYIDKRIDARLNAGRYSCDQEKRVL